VYASGDLDCEGGGGIGWVSLCGRRGRVIPCAGQLLPINTQKKRRFRKTPVHDQTGAPEIGDCKGRRGSSWKSDV